MEIAVKHLEISNFRSIDHLVLENIPAFAVFAGPNGSGKSNFFNALRFLNNFVIFNLETAINNFGGVEEICCWRNKNKKISIAIRTAETCDILDARYIITANLDDDSLAENFIPLNKYIDTNESVVIDSPDRVIFKDGGVILEKNGIQYMTSESQESNLKHLSNNPSTYYRNIKIFRINHNFNSTPSWPDDTPDRLYSSGKNLAKILETIHKENEETWQEILDWMETMVPGFSNITISTDLSGKPYLIFYEHGMDRAIPIHLISEGTYYLLCMLVAVLHLPPQGITLIEEPERGLHPYAIQRLMELFREKATAAHPIWITTHSETVVRQCQEKELWLVDRNKNGCTRIKQAPALVNKSISMDQAWLCNMFGGGLPW